MVAGYDSGRVEQPAIAGCRFSLDVLLSVADTGGSERSPTCAAGW
jgi:hypothetical protein